MAISRFLSYTVILSCLLLAVAGCSSSELPAAPPEVIAQASAATPPVIDFGTPIVSDTANVAKPAASK